MLIISAIVGGFVTLRNGWLFGLPVFLLFFLFQYWKILRNDKFFIAKIEVGESKITINYDEKGEPKTFEGRKEDFRLKKGAALNKVRDTYLAVYYQDELIIKQFLIGSWTVKDFDQLIDIV